VERKLVALGRDRAGRELAKRLEAEHPTSWASRLGAIALLEPGDRAAARADAAARAAFAAGEPAEGARRWREAQADWTAAGKAWRALAEATPARWADDETAWDRAAADLERSGDGAGAAAALERALALPLGEARAAPLRARLEALRRAADLVPFEVDPARADARAGLLASDPLRCWFSPSALTVRCAPDADEWAVVPLEVDRALPLVVQGTLRLGGDAWATTVEAGAFEPREGGPGPDRLTGLEVGLWDVGTGRPWARLRVAGAAAGPLVRLPGFAATVGFRLELRPDVLGGARYRVQLTDGDGALLLADDGRADLAPGTRLLVGLRSPAYRGGNGIVEQARWAMEAKATVEHLRVEASRPRPTFALALGGVEGAHAALALDDAPTARRLYDQRVLREASPEAYFFRGLARGRLGDPAAAEDIVQAAYRAPYRTILWLEDVADELPDAHPGYTAAITSALADLVACAQPLPQAIGRQLGGDLDIQLGGVSDEDPTAAGADAEVQEAAMYLAMRVAHDPQRWRASPFYQRLVPQGRYPRNGLPKVIPLPAAPALPTGPAASDREAAGCLHDQHRRLREALLERGAHLADVRLELATFYSRWGAFGMAAAAAREALARSDLPADRRPAALLLLAQAEAGAGREGELADALARLRETGAYSAEQLATLERDLRSKPAASGPTFNEARRPR
jgi:hypothetical protein